MNYKNITKSVTLHSEKHKAHYTVIIEHGDDNSTMTIEKDGTAIPFIKKEIPSEISEEYFLSLVKKLINKFEDNTLQSYYHI